MAQIKEIIKMFQRAIDELQKLENEEETKIETDKKSEHSPQTTEDNKQNPSSENLFDTVKSLLPNWPSAVNESLICDIENEEDKMDRASGILSIAIPEAVHGKRFLDFGCGEGHCAKTACDKAKVTVGYDLEKSGSMRWENEDEGFLLTTDFDKVSSKGPYDIILLYDVLDHAKGESPTEILIKAKSLLSKQGKIYARCHPWCSRHGGHCYREINKAFIHLYCNDQQLSELTGVPIISPEVKVVRPIATYKSWFKKSGLKSTAQMKTEDAVDKVFESNKMLLEGAKKALNIEKFPRAQMSISFIDYVLEPA